MGEEKQEERRSLVVRVRGGIFLIASMFAVFAYAAAWRGSLPLLMGWIFFFAGLYAAITIHELGHAVAAVACRHRIIIFAVRPIAWNLPNRSVILMAKGYEPGAGGLVAYVPGSAAAQTAVRDAIITAAGPIANIVAAAAAFAVAARYPGAPFGHAFQIDAAGAAFGVQSLAAAAVSLFPVTQGITSDGQKLWALRRRPADWPVWQPLALLLMLAKYNVRLRDRPRWLIDEVTIRTPAFEGRDRMLRSMEIGMALDASSVDVARARRLLDAFLADFGDGEWLASCDAYFTAIWERDAARAAARAWAGERTEDDQAMVEAAAAAIMAAAGDTRAVGAHLHAMNAELAKRTPFADPTFRDITRQITDLLAEQVDRRAPAMLPKSLTL